MRRLVRFRGCCSGVPGVPEVVPALRRGERIERLAQERPQASTVRRPAFRNSALSLANASSIGFKSGLYGGRYHTSAPAAAIAARTSTRLWHARLSITTTSPGRNAGASCCRT